MSFDFGMHRIRHIEIDRVVGKICKVSDYPINKLIYGYWSIGKTTFFYILQGYLQNQKANLFNIICIGWVANGRREGPYLFDS